MMGKPTYTFSQVLPTLSLLGESYSMGMKVQVQVQWFMVQPGIPNVFHSLSFWLFSARRPEATGGPARELS